MTIPLSTIEASAQPTTIDHDSIKAHRGEVLNDKGADDHVEKVETYVQMKSDYDKLSIWQTLKLFKTVVIICSLAGFTAALDGYQFKLSANIVANPGFIRQYASNGTKLDPVHVSVWGGLTSVGLFIGQLIIPYFNECFGRKGGVFAFLAMLLIGTIIESVGTVWWHWMIAKLFAGAGIGACQATLPVFINEHSPARVRGSLIVMYSAWFQLGQLFASVTLKARADVAPLDYKTPIYTQFGMIGLAVVIFVFLPETPWYLARKQNLEKARKSLAFTSKGIVGYDLEKELAVILASIESEKQKQLLQPSKFTLFRGLNLKRFIIGAWPKTLQQFVGLSIFNNYSAYFFQLAGNPDPFMVTVLLGVVQVVAILFDAVLVDRIGRRWMTMIGFGGACFGVTLMAVVGCFDYRSKELGSVLVFAGVTANFFNAFQSSTSYTYMTEMPALHFRAISIGWGLAFCNIFLVPVILDVWQVRAAFLFVALGVPGTFLAFFIMPESTGRSPAEIQELFEDHVPLRRWKGYITQVERTMPGAHGA